MRVSFSEIGEEVQAGLVGPWDKCTMPIYGDISIHFIIQRVEGGHWMIGNESKEGEQDANLCNLRLEPCSCHQLVLGQLCPRHKLVLGSCHFWVSRHHKQKMGPVLPICFCQLSLGMRVRVRSTGTSKLSTAYNKRQLTLAGRILSTVSTV